MFNMPVLEELHFTRNYKTMDAKTIYDECDHQPNIPMYTYPTGAVRTVDDLVKLTGHRCYLVNTTVYDGIMHIILMKSDATIDNVDVDKQVFKIVSSTITLSFGDYNIDRRNEYNNNFIFSKIDDAVAFVNHANNTPCV